MNTLIEIKEQTIGQETVQTVNARELYAFLEVNVRFNDWIARQIEEYFFKENQNFVSFTQKRVKPNAPQENQGVMSFGKNLSKPKGGRPSIEYHLTLDIAKELSMVESNEKKGQT